MSDIMIEITDKWIRENLGIDPNKLDGETYSRIEESLMRMGDKE